MGSNHPIRKFVASDPVVVPDKLYFRIGDVARLCDVPPYVLRFWETEFPQLKPNKGGTGQRLYRKKDVEIALRIKRLLYDQGYTIPGARQTFRSEAVETAPLTAAAPAPVVLQPQPVPVDLGAQIRQDAQQRDRLQTLREELTALARLLAGPRTVTEATTLPALAGQVAPRIQPLRPLLVLEPAQAPAAVAHPAKSGIHLNQGDLFAAE